jgi:hypothetical protein
MSSETQSGSGMKLPIPIEPSWTLDDDCFQSLLAPQFKRPAAKERIPILERVINPYLQG